MIHYPPELPVSEKRHEIAQALRQHQVVVVAGETGSGKTTQLPKICLEMGLAEAGLIGHTQPRRLAARAVATRIAEELGTTPGGLVGYQVRFNDKTGPETAIKLMTDGILLAEIQQDRLLRKYQVLIIDEAHERSLNIDFLLGYLKRLLPQRRDLKVVITSATIDVEKFSQHFDDAPIISVSGRTYPVEILYQDPDSLPDDSDDEPLHLAVSQAIRTLDQVERERRQRPGDMLIFLSGERDIRSLAQYLRKQALPHTEILPLYARLSQAEQQRIFGSHTGRRIVLSTNVAETSLTVPGIRYVIDSGLARISRYSVQSKVQRLPIEPISQASANQRAGRCGRTSNGICIRLYSEQDFLGRPEFTDPEIQRTNLSAVILQMLMLKLGDISEFPFIEMPERKAINDGFRLLDELGAVTPDKRLTAMGRRMARLPADPRLARMLLEAGRRKCLYEMLVIVSALSIQDPRETPADKRQAAREAHQEFQYSGSDFLSWVTLWQNVETQRQELSAGQFRKYCQRHFLSWLRLREWRETHRQLTLACQSDGLKAKQPSPETEIEYEAVHRSILPGSLNQIGQKTQEGGLYVGSRGRRFSLFPSSGLYRSMPRWIVTGDLIETQRLFATTAARIEPEWAVEAAPHLVKREYSEAHWSRRRGEVLAYERVTLFGLVLIEKRRVSYSNIDPELSRSVFIREGLVAEQLNTRLAFYRHNSALLAEIRRQEQKERKPDILVADDQLAAFYESRLPESILTVAALERWCRVADKQAVQALFMQREQITAREITEDSVYAFPDHTEVQHNKLRLDYQFSPGSSDDGISLKVPAPLLIHLTQEDLDWAVPGLVNERCVALVRGLPKTVRKLLVPVPEFVNQALQDVTADDKPLLTELLAARAQQLRRVRISPEHWDEDNVPRHLRPLLRVVDGNGKTIDQGHDLQALQRKYRRKSGNQPGVDAAPVARHPVEQQGLREWSFGVLPAQVEIRQGIRLIRYPAIQDAGDAVDIVLCETESEAALRTQYGLARLLILRTPQQKALILGMLKQVQQRLGLKLIGQAKDWQEHALLAVYRLGFELAGQRPGTKAEYEALFERHRADLVAGAERVCRLISAIYNDLYELRAQLRKLPGQYKAARKDIEEQLDWLVPDSFPAHTPDPWLWEIPRYIKGIRFRLEKLPAQPDRDRQAMQAVHELASQWQASHINGQQGALAEFPWWLQELRISLFAQQLGTRAPVSVKRLQKQLAPPGILSRR